MRGKHGPLREFWEEWKRQIGSKTGWTRNVGTAEDRQKSNQDKLCDELPVQRQCQRPKLFASL